MFGKNKSLKFGTALSLVLVSVGLCLVIPEAAQKAAAADFKHAKKVIVPPSRIPRRYDYDSLNGRLASPGVPHGYRGLTNSHPSATQPTNTDTYTIHTSQTKSSSKPIKSYKKGKYELVPPPPPVSPSLLPSSMVRDIPAPPPVRKTRYTNTGRFSPHERIFSNYSRNQNKRQSSQAYLVQKANKLAAEGHLKDAQALLIKHRKGKNSEVDQAIADLSKKRAKYYLRKDSFGEAKEQARIALTYRPENKEAISLLNQALRHQGIDPLNSASRLAEARKLFTHDKNSEAKVEYLESLRLKPSADAHIGIGNIAFRNQNYKQAKVSYTKALDLAPQSSVALRQLGITRYKLTDVVGANADLTRALVQNPQDKLASQTLIDLWQRQVSSRPNDANSHLGLARAYQLSNQLKAAQAEYRTVVKIDPNHPNLPAARQSFKLALARQQALKAYQAGLTLEAHAAYREAFDRASEAVRLSPGNTKYKLLQAQLLEKLGDLAGAKSAYLHILSIEPTNSTAAKRIKSLNLMAVPTARTGTINSTTNNGRVANLNVPQYRGEGPALPYLPGPYKNGTYSKVPTADPVQNMTGFLGSLRNLMLTQKKDLEKSEDQMMTKLGLSGGSSSSSIGSLPKLDNIDTSAPKIDTSKLITSSDVQKVLSGAGSGTSSSSTTKSSSSGSPTSSGSSSTASSSANTSSSPPKTWSELAINTGQSLAQNTRLKSLADLAAQSAPNIMNKKFTAEDAHRIINSVAKSQGSKPAPKAASSTTQTKDSTTGATNSRATNTQVGPAPQIARSVPITAPSIGSRNGGSYPPLAPPIRKNAITSPNITSAYNNRIGSLEHHNRALQNQLSNTQKELEKLKASSISESVRAEIESTDTKNSLAKSDELVHKGAELRGAIPQLRMKPINQVHLELLGVKADRKQIRLKVRLRNNQDSELNISSSKKAVIRMAGTEDKLAPLKFPKKKLKAHSAMEGYIKVPGKRLSPAADVFIPELAGVDPENKLNVHLTVPISSLPVRNH